MMQGKIANRILITNDDGINADGLARLEKIARELSELAVDVIGLNCSVGPAVMLDAIEEMAEVTHLPLVAQPNAGLPRTVRDRKMYLASPEYMAQYARRMIDAGVRFVGGCCGTTPQMIRTMHDYIRSVGSTTATVAPMAAMATHMSEGCTAIQCSEVPSTANTSRLWPSMAEQPVPGSRLLHGEMPSRK